MRLYCQTEVRVREKWRNTQLPEANLQKQERIIKKKMKPSKFNLTYNVELSATEVYI